MTHLGFKSTDEVFALMGTPRFAQHPLTPRVEYVDPYEGWVLNCTRIGLDLWTVDVWFYDYVVPTPAKILERRLN